MKPTETLKRFDSFLAKEGLRLEAVVIGATALSLLGLIDRQTRDVDVLAPRLPPDIASAANRFAVMLRASGETLADDWLNNGPDSLASQLPADWENRLQDVYTGKALLLRTLSHKDLLRTKLFALCDRGTDLGDCLALNPSPADLTSLEPWIAYQDANPDWPKHVQVTLRDLAQRLGHGV